MAPSDEDAIPERMKRLGQSSTDPRTAARNQNGIIPVDVHGCSLLLNCCF
jgi:hypothetical protein